MRQFMLLATVAALAGWGLMTNEAAAIGAGGASQPRPAAASSLVEKVSYRCWRWRNKCEWRWGYDTPRFRKCMWRHGC